MRTFAITLAIVIPLVGCGDHGQTYEPTKASESVYENDIRRAYTSEGLTKADLAWHALNTYGWDCEEVISQEAPTNAGYFFITCSSGIELRVYLRPGQHPSITNFDGGFK